MLISTFLQDTWQKTIVPEIVQLKQKFGAKWQTQAPQLVAALKQKAGQYYEKAVNFVNQKLPQGPKGPKAQ